MRRPAGSAGGDTGRISFLKSNFVSSARSSDFRHRMAPGRALVWETRRSALRQLRGIKSKKARFARIVASPPNVEPSPNPTLQRLGLDGTLKDFRSEGTARISAKWKIGSVRPGNQHPRARYTYYLRFQRERRNCAARPCSSAAAFRNGRPGYIPNLSVRPCHTYRVRT